jgi:hypothetical protein
MTGFGGLYIRLVANTAHLAMRSHQTGVAAPGSRQQLPQFEPRREAVTQ